VYQRIENLQQEPNKKQMVFCAIHTVGKPYLNYDQVPKSERGIDVPLVLFLLRWDGCIGFPGGNVDEGETLIEAVVREAQEEINFDLDIKKLEPLSSFRDDSKNIHCFSYKVDGVDAIKKIIKDATESEHFLAENQGCFAVQAANFDRNRGLPQFLLNNFIATSRFEFDILLKEKLGLTI
jgi:U8 snoRNA-decapping enzyme